MKILILTDLEGAAGVVSFEEQAAANGKFYEVAKRLLTAEVNAAVEGMLQEGVKDIVVIDGHGAGGICYEELHASAKLFHGRPWAWDLFMKEIAKDFDATVMIGQHSMAGTERGTLNHTQSSATVEYYKLNGQPIGEIAQWALAMGAQGIPLIFLSGDDCACREAEDLVPGLTTAAVKTGLSRTSAISLSVPEAHRVIMEGIRKAIQQQKTTPVNPVVWKGPFILEKKYFHTGIAYNYHANTRARIIDAHRVEFKSDNIADIIYG